MKKQASARPSAYRFLPWVALVCLGLIIGACGKKKLKAPVKNYLHQAFRDSLFDRYNPLSLQTILKMRLVRKVHSFHHGPLLLDYYARQTFAPRLLEHYLPDHGLTRIFTRLDESRYQGLGPAYYHSKQLHLTIQSFQDHHFTSLVEAYIGLADLELISMDAILDYARDLRFGRLSPQSWIAPASHLTFKKPDSSFYQSVLYSGDILGLLDSLNLKSTPYFRLSALYRAMVSRGDTKNWSVAGAPTTQDSMRKLRVNLERLRWRMSDTIRRYILVNIPEFRLYAVDQESTLFSMKVCVGQKKKQDFDQKMLVYLQTHKIDDRPENHQTPLLYSEIQSIQVNPKWSVPKSIVENEIFYKMAKNPKYLMENQMKVYKGSMLMERPDTIRWASLKRDKIPYTIKQDAGDFNSLGKLKFNFRNSYSVYLHDTPNKKAFKKAERDVSHGCVRVEDPLRLARFLLESDGKNAMDLLRIKIGLKPGDDSSAHLQRLYEKEQEMLDKNNRSFEPSSMVLKKKIPVFIFYYTAGVDDKHQIFFKKDLYDLDKKIWTLLGSE